MGWRREEMVKIKTTEEILEQIKHHIEKLAKKGWDRLYYERDRDIIVTFNSKEAGDND